MFDEYDCRVCGCTDDDCQCCYEHTGGPCWWVETDLCSACTGREQQACPGLVDVP